MSGSKQGHDAHVFLWQSKEKGRSLHAKEDIDQVWVWSSYSTFWQGFALLNQMIDQVNSKDQWIRKAMILCTSAQWSYDRDQTTGPSQQCNNICIRWRWKELNWRGAWWLSLIILSHTLSTLCYHGFSTSLIRGLSDGTIFHEAQFHNEDKKGNLRYS